MSGAAIAMMAVAIVIIWGGLVAAIINLRRGTGEDVEPGRFRDL